MLVLGIETSCDETAAALVTDKREICANVVLSQLDEHAPYGGIVPEIAARSHIEHLDGVIARARNRLPSPPATPPSTTTDSSPVLSRGDGRVWSA